MHGKATCGGCWHCGESPCACGPLGLAKALIHRARHGNGHGHGGCCSHHAPAAPSTTTANTNAAATRSHNPKPPGVVTRSGVATRAA